MTNLDTWKKKLKSLSLEELETLEDWIREEKKLITQNVTVHKKQKSSSKRLIVKALSGRTPSGKQAIWQLEYVRCGKVRCQKCASGEGHGPYWYYYWREGNKEKLKTKYWGKNDPLSLINKI